ncbi:MAG: hypothetical protein MUE68_00030 [Bacteroidetes bacterium]|jgi:hypothetical protein|nr:hypothetical protein [Bacteroidota bacterium]
MIGALIALLAGGCAEDRFDLSTLPTGGTNVVGETTYVQLNPAWTGFNQPQAIVIGNEPFAYVADTENDRIVMLDLSGRVIGVSPPVRRPIALAQDKRLQLLVCAQFDTLLPGRTVPTTFGAIYRLDLPAAAHGIAQASPRRVFFEPSDSSRRYTSVATMFDNSYYVTRIGPKNELARVDRDRAVLLFAKNDSLITPVTQNFSPDGTGLLSIHQMTAIATLPTGRSVEYVFAQVEAPTSSIVPFYKVQWIRLVAEGQTTNYVSKFYPSADGEIDLLRINRFTRPVGLTLDPSGNLFVADAARDSIYRFNTRGVERYSFGGSGSGTKQFNAPAGLAFFDRTLYVADKGNNRIVRFRLSTDLR